MPDPEQPPGLESPAPDAVAVRPQRPKRKRSLKIDRDKVAEFIKTTFTQDINDRQERIDLRMDRYEKLNGWLPEKSWPWSDCSNFWIPTMLIASRRMGATLENAVKSMRPVAMAKAKQKHNAGAEENINAVLDYQLFVENDGEKILDAFCTNFVNDEVAYLYIPWVREDQTVREIRILPDPLDPTIDHVVQITMPVSGALAVMFETLQNFTMKDNQGWRWEVLYLTDDGKPQTALVEFFDTDDGKLEGYITKDVRTFDGPCPQVPDFEDIVFPVRSGNLQPPSGANPHGAPYFHHICKTDIDAISRRMANGTYDLLTEDEFEAVKTGKSPVGSGEPEDEPKARKDEQGGDQIGTPGQGNDRQLLVTYTGWDVNGDGFDEQVIFWSIRCGNKVYPAAMRFLSEVYPGTPLCRPVISESIFPEPNRIYGRSFIDALEPIQDMSQTSMNQHFDWGTMTNMPTFFYRAASGMKPEPIMLEPGVGNPLDDPERDVKFPQFAQRGETFNINTMSLLQQLSEKLSFSEIAFGRIPTGKASALRTTGTTNALMSQVDVSSERILRRLFHAICATLQMMHRLNRRYLSDRKQIVMIGLAKQGEDPYKEIQSKEIDADIDFEFKATMLNTNKQILGQVLQQSLALAASPIALQAGLVTPEQLYNLYYDLYKAQDLDPDRYVKKPMGLPPGPKLTAEEVFTMIVEGDMPMGSPAEPPQEHLQKLMQMAQTPPTNAFFAMFSPERKQMFQQWAMQIQQMIMLMMQQQMMMAQAAGGGGGNGKEGPGGVESEQNPDTGANAPVQPGEFIDGSLGNEVPQ